MDRWADAISDAEYLPSGVHKGPYFPNYNLWDKFERSPGDSTGVLCVSQGVAPMKRSAIDYLSLSRQNWELNKRTRYLVNFKYNIY